MMLGLNGENTMRLTVSQLRRIIKEEVSRAMGAAPTGVPEDYEVAEELDVAAADWVEQNRDELVAMLADNPELADKIVAAGKGKVAESYVGDLGRGVVDSYKKAAAGHFGGAVGALGLGGAGGYLTAEIMAMMKDPSLIPFTMLRELQLDDKITMDGSALKAMAVGALVGHLVGVAMDAKKYAAQQKVKSRPRRK